MPQPCLCYVPKVTGDSPYPLHTRLTANMQLTSNRIHTECNGHIYCATFPLSPYPHSQVGSGGGAAGVRDQCIGPPL